MGPIRSSIGTSTWVPKEFGLKINISNNKLL